MKQPFDLHDYSDIIDLPHKISPNRRRMTNVERGAQFSPFAALTGYGDAVDEAGRRTEVKRRLSEDEKAMIDAKLQFLLEHPDEKQEVTVTYFRPDAQKSGGAYCRVSGCIARIDTERRCIVFEDHTEIPIHSIFSLDGAVFCRFDAE